MDLSEFSDDAKKLLCAAAAFFCPFVAWIAGAMMWGWSDARGNDGNVITPEFFSGIGVVLFCGPLLLIGLASAVVTIWQGFRIVSFVAVVLNFGVAKWLFFR